MTLSEVDCPCVYVHRLCSSGLTLCAGPQGLHERDGIRDS